MLLDTHTPELNRPFFIKERPRHRETLASFSDRLLAVNLEDDLHRRHLLIAAKRAQPTLTEEERWARVVTTKAGLQPHHFDRARHSGLHHADGQHCRYCTSGITERWMCTHCTRGTDVQQYAHFDSNICLKHNRWVGPETAPTDQRQATPAHMKAEVAFRRLKRRRKLDPVLYMLIRNALRDGKATTKPDNNNLTDFEHYPTLIHVLDAVTDPLFLSRLLDPRERYAAAHEQLQDRIATIVGAGHEAVTTALWLFLRSTFLSIRKHRKDGTPFTSAWVHDFPVPTWVIATLPATMRDQPFKNYLEASGDYRLTTSNWRAVQIHHLNPSHNPRTNQHADDDYEGICVEGHRITRWVKSLSFDGSPLDSCRVCSFSVVEAGFNDIATRYPLIGAEFHPENNNGADPRQILAGSTTSYNWRCPDFNHVYPATPANRIRGQSDCSICANKRFEPGINDIETVQPKLAEEWHPTRNARSAAETPIGTSDKAWWICRLGHEWEASISSRARGAGCKNCAARKVRRNGNSFAKARPGLVPEWDRNANGNLGPEDVAARSNEMFYWRCPEFNHSYKQSTDKRFTGSGCSICSHRKVAPDETDVATLYPRIARDWDCSKNNGVSPRDILPGTKLYFWLCRFGHEHGQSVPNRVKSQGCISCPKELRSGFTGRY